MIQKIAEEVQLPDLEFKKQNNKSRTEPLVQIPKGKSLCNQSKTILEGIKHKSAIVN